MQKIDFEKYVQDLVEKHLPTYFMNEKVLMSINDMISNNTEMNRREILMLAYSIGANAEEANNLLAAKKYQPLYVKRREDAIWRFVLNNRTDLTTIIEEIFPQDVDENKI